MKTRNVKTHAGVALPALGQGTWRMGEDPFRRSAEVRALRLGLDLGMTLLDTAEMYASGGAELIVGEAIRGRREEVFLVSKVLPSNASYDGTLRAAEKSLKRMGVECMDLYLLHWPGSHPLEETLRAFRQLKEQGKIRSYGVSNFDHADLESALSLAEGSSICCNQVLYNLARRSAEWSLLSLCEQREIALMAYSPLDQASLARIPGSRAKAALDEVARRHGATPSQIALAFTLRHPVLVSIPKATKEEHVRENAGALAIELTPEDQRALDEAFEPPTSEQPLDVY